MSEQLLNESANTELERISGAVNDIKKEIHKLVVGQEKMLDLLIIGLLSGGHILLEGVPGVAKTLTAKLLSQVFHLKFNRIQFTPDLLPADVIGTSVFNLKTSEFTFNHGPIFANVILADEINRAPAKTQAAMFEVMEEFQVTVDGHTHKLDQPFYVIATQNPIEQEGTYKLPEAQLDRFMFKIHVEYPNLQEEIAIMNRYKGAFNLNQHPEIKSVLTAQDIEKCRHIIESIYIKDELITYIAALIHNTRNNSSIYIGASPRASLAILKTAKAHAAIRGRNFVIPEDIQFVAYPVLTHRLILTPEKEMEGITPEDVIKEIIESVEVPR